MADTADDAVAAGPDALWDDWGTPPRVPGIPELHLDGFDGPMDLLLDLAERQRIDLGRISIAQLARQFVTALEQLQRHVPLERRADWVIVATQLLLLRSRLLLPGESAEAAETAEAALDADREAERLEDMISTRRAVAWLEGRLQLGWDVFARPHGRNPRVASYMSLMEACLFVLRGPEGQAGAEEEVYRPAPMVFFRVDQAMARIRALVAGQGAEVTFEACLPAVAVDDQQRELKARSAVANSFIAALEMVRQEQLSAIQLGPWETIMLGKSEPGTLP